MLHESDGFVRLGDDGTMVMACFDGGVLIRNGGGRVRLTRAQLAALVALVLPGLMSSPTDSATTARPNSSPPR